MTKAKDALPEPSKIESRTVDITLHCGHSLSFAAFDPLPQKGEWMLCLKCDGWRYVAQTFAQFMVRCREVGCGWRHERLLKKNSAQQAMTTHYQQTGHRCESKLLKNDEIDTDSKHEGWWNSFSHSDGYTKKGKK